MQVSESIGNFRRAKCNLSKCGGSTGLGGVARTERSSSSSRKKKGTLTVSRDGGSRAKCNSRKGKLKQVGTSSKDTGYKLMKWRHEAMERPHCTEE